MAYQKPRRSYRSKNKQASNDRNQRKSSNRKQTSSSSGQDDKRGSNDRRRNHKKNDKRSRDRNNKNNRSRGSSRAPSQTGERVEGYLYVSREGFGFLRTPEKSLASSNNDVFVPAQLVQRYKMKTGVHVVARAVRKQKRFPVVFIESIEGDHPEKYSRNNQFKNIVSVDPNRRIRLECDLEGQGTNDLTLRLIDLVTPVGFGQRALIVAPPRTGKTVILHKIANSILKNHRAAEVYVLLVDERPEEVTDFTRSCVGAKIFASSFDKDTMVHVELAEMTLEICKRRVEAGVDVVLLIDSLTRVARAFNLERGNSRRTLSGGLDASAMHKPRELFGAARCGEQLGTLTIIATALIDTGSALDQVIFEEFKGTGNLELVLSRKLVLDRIFPALDVQKSGTRKEEKLRTFDEMRRTSAVRRMLLRGKPTGAMLGLRKELKRFSTNAEFLQSLPVEPVSQKR